MAAKLNRVAQRIKVHGGRALVVILLVRTWELILKENIVALGHVVLTSNQIQMCPDVKHTGIDMTPGHLYGLLTGLASLIPLPFVDEIVISVIHNLMGKRLLASYPDAKGRYVVALWGSSNGLWSRVKGFLWSFPKWLVVKTVQKFLKTALFWLAIRSAILQALHTNMVYQASNVALNAGLLDLPQTHIDMAIKEVRHEIERSISNADVRFLLRRSQRTTLASVEASVAEMILNRKAANMQSFDGDG